jgi:chaperone modulatory protein CbpM
MPEHRKLPIEGQVIDDRTEITIVQLCRRCEIEAELVERMVTEGIIEPSKTVGSTLYFPHSCVKRTRVVLRLRSDLGVNLAGAALALELMERIEALKSRLRMNTRLERSR